MTLSIVADGADPNAQLRSFALKIPAPAYSGSWATIDLQPDLFSPQRFCIGVVVVDGNDGLSFRVISDASKFECVYGRAAGASIRALVESAERTLVRAFDGKVQLDKLEFESDNLSISTPMPTSGASPEAVLNRLFGDVVAMDQGGEKAQRDFISLDTAQVRLLVSNELKRIAGIAHERVIMDATNVIVRDESGRVHRLDVNLRSEKGAGSIVSAVYKTPSTIELSLLRGSRDLATYARIKKLDDIALFIVSASRDQFGPGEYERVSELLDEQSWRLENQGLRVTTFDEPLRVAHSVLEWAHLT